MTTQQILREVEALPREEQERLARTIEERLGARAPEHEKAAADIERRRAASRRLLGAVKWDGPLPTDEEVEKMRYEHLMEKYG